MCIRDRHNAEEYASDRVEGGVDRTTHEAAHQFDKQGRKGLKETKRNVSKACLLYTSRSLVTLSLQ